MGRLVLVVITTLFCGVLCSVNLNDVLPSIPQQERINFLKYHVEKGHKLETSGDVDYDMGLSDDFSVLVYQTMLKSNAVDVEDPETKVALACIICWANGNCVDLCDPGVHPE